MHQNGRTTHTGTTTASRSNVVVPLSLEHGGALPAQLKLTDQGHRSRVLGVQPGEGESRSYMVRHTVVVDKQIEITDAPTARHLYTVVNGHKRTARRRRRGHRIALAFPGAGSAVFVPHDEPTGVCVVHHRRTKFNAGRTTGERECHAKVVPVHEIRGGISLHRVVQTVGVASVVQIGAGFGVVGKRVEATRGATAGCGTAIDAGAGSPIVKVKVVRAIDTKDGGLARDDRVPMLVQG